MNNQKRKIETLLEKYEPRCATINNPVIEGEKNWRRLQEVKNANRKDL